MDLTNRIHNFFDNNKDIKDNYNIKQQSTLDNGYYEQIPIVEPQYMTYKLENIYKYKNNSSRNSLNLINSNKIPNKDLPELIKYKNNNLYYDEKLIYQMQNSKFI